MALTPKNLDIPGDPNSWEETEIRHFLQLMDLDPSGPLDVIRDRVIDNFITNQNESVLETSLENISGDDFEDATVEPKMQAEAERLLETLSFTIQTSLTNETTVVDLCKNVLTVAHGLFLEASKRNKAIPKLNE